MIGIYDYTVILTYLSLLSGMSGIIIATSGFGHPYIGCIFLLFSGLCDTFDGIVARSKANRTEEEKTYGVQIDSLSDLVAFGVLPGAIAVGLFTSGGREFRVLDPSGRVQLYPIIFFCAVLVYVLAALIRLGYFNMLEITGQGTDENGKKRFIGLPVTSAALIFPMILLLNHLTVRDFSLIYFLALPVMSLLFLGRFSIKKPSKRMIGLLLLVGLIEFLLLLFTRMGD